MVKGAFHSDDRRAEQLLTIKNRAALYMINPVVGSVHAVLAMCGAW
jgi:hypothetical protein